VYRTVGTHIYSDVIYSNFSRNDRGWQTSYILVTAINAVYDGDDREAALDMLCQEKKGLGTEVASRDTPGLWIQVRPKETVEHISGHRVQPNNHRDSCSSPAVPPSWLRMKSTLLTR
jgi:hypothetical protein